MGTDELKRLTKGTVSREEQLYTAYTAVNSVELTGIYLVRAPSMQPNLVSTSVKLLDLTSTSPCAWDKGGSERETARVSLYNHESPLQKYNLLFKNSQFSGQ